MKSLIVLGLLVAAPLSAPAAAAPADNQTAQASAIKSLEAAAAIDPRDGGSQIELASAYLRAGRTADATIAFRRALALDNVMLEMPNGDSIWSHQIAKAALANDVQLTAR